MSSLTVGCACTARISTELEELKRSQSMSSLWKLHADALVVLLDIASTTTEEAAGVAKLAENSDGAASSKAIHETLQKLRSRSELAVKALPASGHKCARCWNFMPEVSNYGVWENVCTRCHGALTSMGVEPPTGADGDGEVSA